MKGAIAVLFALVLLQSSLLDARPVDAKNLNSNRIPICRHPLRFVMVGTERIPCDWDPEPGYLPECARCSSSRQCLQPKCWGGKCTDGSDASLRRCFKAECASCRSPLECSTKKCWGGKCVYNTQASKDKCFPPRRYPECHYCTRASQCITNKCWGRKCVYNTQASKDKCFPHHPEPCHLLRQTVTDPEEVVRLRRICP